jgi:IS30 family transposase
MPAVRVMLTLPEREEISRGLAEGLLYKEIGVVIGRDPSIVSREVSRHGGRAGYRAVGADTAATVSRARPKLFAVERSARLRAVVSERLRSGWSPASIAGRLPELVPDDQACRVSHEAIYQWVYAQPVSTLARELIRLRTGRPARRSGPRPEPRNTTDPRSPPRRPTTDRRLPCDPRVAASLSVSVTGQRRHHRQDRPIVGSVIRHVLDGSAGGLIAELPVLDGVEDQRVPADLGQLGWRR